MTEEMNSHKEKLQRAAMEERVELEKKLEDVQKLLDDERERLHTLQKSLECEENPQLTALKQKLQAQHDREMNTAKTAMAAEVKELNALLQDQMERKLHDALCRSFIFHFSFFNAFHNAEPFKREVVKIFVPNVFFEKCSFVFLFAMNSEKLAVITRASKKYVYNLYVLTLDMKKNRSSWKRG